MKYTTFDHECMALALRLARRGMTTTDPNPRVGCVLARDGEVVGQGWHRAAGEPHAEINALAQAADRARGATAYVTLEPCSHRGRTPPCTEALARAGVASVVVAHKDPNPEVDGFSALRAAGIECRAGLMESVALELNPGFMSRMRHGRPWVRIKLAQSLDGAVALGSGESQWISGPAARADVQAWRARSSVLLTGIGTVLADDPRLDVRLDGEPRQPLRVIVDSHWRTPPPAKILQPPGQVLVAGLASAETPRELLDGPAELLELPGANGRVDLVALLQALADRQVNEIQVEAGPTLCGALLEARLVDEVLIYQAPSLLGIGARTAFALGPLAHMSDRHELAWLDVRRLGGDLRLRLRPQYPDEPCLPGS